MSLFGKNPEKQAQDAAAEAEAERLVALPVAELAAEMLPAFGPDGPGKGKKAIGGLQVGIYLTRDFPRSRGSIKPLLDPIREGIQALENAGLVKRQLHTNATSSLSATRLGLQAIEEGTAMQYLGGPASSRPGDPR